MSGLSRRIRRFIVVLLCCNFNVISVALLIFAFWRPLQAVMIFALLFFITLVGSPVRISRPITVGKVWRGMWNWLRYLMATPQEDKQ